MPNEWYGACLQARSRPTPQHHTLEPNTIPFLLQAPGLGSRSLAPSPPSSHTGIGSWGPMPLLPGPVHWDQAPSPTYRAQSSLLQNFWMHGEFCGLDDTALEARGKAPIIWDDAPCHLHLPLFKLLDPSMGMIYPLAQLIQAINCLWNMDGKGRCKMYFCQIMGNVK